MTLWIALAIAIVYSAGLFAIAVAGDRGRFDLSARQRSLIYGLSLAVYATSWTFYGAVGTAVSSGLEFIPIYLGPILLFTVGYPLVARTLRLGKSVHATSIADFLSTRYGKSGQVAAIITVIATIGLLPYVALQLKSVAQTLAALSPDLLQTAQASEVVLVVAGVMALFAILFGTRSIDLTQQNRGLVITIAVEAVVKLLALLAMTAFAFWLLAGSEGRQLEPSEIGIFRLDQVDARFWVLTLISFCAALCLPRQFHMTVVEAHKDRPDAIMRWTFPIYLVIITLAVFPITLAGLSHLDFASAHSDMIMLSLPLSRDMDWLAIFVFIGGFSAATGMIIVSTLALSTMITNDLVVPLVYRNRQNLANRIASMGRQLLWIRRSVIIGCLALAYSYYRTIDSNATLAGLGTLSFAAVAQFMPGLIGGLYWERGNAAGMKAGLAAGFLAWLTLLILPAYLGGGPVISIAEDPLVSGVVISLALNAALYVAGSILFQPNLLDSAQAISFVTMDRKQQDARAELETKRVIDFRLLLQQFVGEESSRAAMIALRQTHGKTYSDLDPADNALIELAENRLSGILGASSARALVNSTLEGDAVPLEEVVAMFDEASQRLQFSGELLQTAVENIDQGIAVVDREMRLVAWNSRYIEMFDLPEHLVAVGQPIAELIAFNLRRSDSDEKQVAAEVEKRLGHMRSGRRHEQEREQPDGRILKITGNPTPQQGYVTSYTDVTADRRQEQALEAMVAERTQQLTEANAALEKATRSKTRFLAAASHDLVQPMNAARLFTSALAEEIEEEKTAAKRLVGQIDHSIDLADNLLRTLLDISKLDGGGLKPEPIRFPLDQIFADLKGQFEARAQDKGITLNVVPSSIWLRTDHGMLVSIVQNLLSNAIRYTGAGKILLGARRCGQDVDIQVWDTGPGIAEDQRELIFEEFRRLDSSQAKEGIGLGLALAQRLANLLGSEIRLWSEFGKGSCFSIRLPRAEAKLAGPGEVLDQASQGGSLKDADILCIDNDASALEALSGLLTKWGGRVTAATAIGDELPDLPDLLILDYQLDDGVTGDEIYRKLTSHWNARPPTILLTAENTDATLALSRNLGFERLLKPASPMALRALIAGLLKHKPSKKPGREKAAR